MTIPLYSRVPGWPLVPAATISGDHQRRPSAAAISGGRCFSQGCESRAEGAYVDVLVELGGIHEVAHRTRRPAAKTRAWIDFLSARMKTVA